MSACVVIMAGLPGTGKSTLAQSLAAKTGGVVLDKDRVRAALFPEPWIEYSQRQDDFCVEILLQTAGYLLGVPETPPCLFIDGRVFTYRYQMERIVNWVKQAGCQVKIIHTVCSDDAARGRLSAGGHPARNRNYELYLKLKPRFEPIEFEKLTVNTEETLDQTVTQCLQYLRSWPGA